MSPVPERTERPVQRDERYRKTDRLRARREFVQVQRTGTRVRTRHFIIVLRASDRQRFGVTVTKKVAGAVGRNRVKRLSREAFRRHRDWFPMGHEIVLLARSGAHLLSYEAVCAELQQASPAMVRATRGERPAGRRGPGTGKPRGKKPA